MMTIKAEEKPLKKIFSDDYLFEIPDYQRPYAWTTEQTGELLDDLLDAMNRNKEIPYFLGSIVLIKDSGNAHAKIVDGQQRLTTLTILFCVLRELSECKRYQGDMDICIRAKGNLLLGTETRFRLSLRKRDQEFFRDKVQDGKRLEDFVISNLQLPDSQQSIRENARYLWDKLKKDNQERYENLAKFLLSYCYLVVVSAADRDSAYRIFSVMNDRGLNLSPTDILKAEIIGGIERDERSKYTNEWENIEEDLGREDFRNLFAHIRMIHVKSKAQGNLTKEFREGVLRKVKGSEFINTVLIPMADAYGIVSRATYKSDNNPEAVNTYLRHLKRLDNFNWVPPALVFFSQYMDSQEALIWFIRDLERLAYAMLILRTNINGRVNRYARLLHEIEEGNDLQTDTSALQLSKEEKEDVRRELDGPVYLQPRVRMPLLLRLDSLLAGKGATYERKVLSIEHVLPQTPEEDSGWLEWFPDPEEREIWRHRLANLVLLSRRKNSQAQNFDFERKKNEYFWRNGVAPFPITLQVLDTQDWTPDTLAERQQNLIDLLANEWRL